MNRNCGYTLHELLTCIFITCVLSSMAIPPLRAALQSSQQNQLIHQMLGTLNFARGSAVFGHSTVGICSGLSRCQEPTLWSNQLLVFIDRNRNGQRDAGEELLRSESMAADYAWHWSNFRHRNYMQFEQDGTTKALNGTLTLCRGSQPIKQLVINLTGRVRAQPPAATANCT